MNRSFFVLCCAWMLMALTTTLQADQEDDEEPDSDVAVTGAPELFDPPVRLEAADGVIDSGPSWGHSSPWIADADDDGRKDLVVGDFSGLFRVYHNEGSDREPRYAEAVNLQAGGVEAKVPIY